jgi:hypothetical protein
MRKSRILGYALTLAATLAVGSAMGQIKTDYTDITTDGVAASKSYITAGAKLGFYAYPDVAFSAAYVASGNKNINKGTTWTWSIPAGATLTGGGQSYTTPAPGALGDGSEETANYVEITAGNTAKVLTVSYNENSAFGFACPGDTKTFDLHIFPAPSADLNNQTTIVKNCGDYTLTATDLVLTTNATDKLDLYWSRDVDELVVNAGTGALAPKGSAVKTTLKYSNATTALTPDVTDGLAWAYSVTTAYSAGDATNAPANGTQTLKATGKLSVVSGHKVGTMYRYYFSAADGVNDFVSRRSQYLALGANVKDPTKCTRYKAATTHEVVFYVVNKPTTGPVYHIGNAFAN